MNIKLTLAKDIKNNHSVIYIINELSSFAGLKLSSDEEDYLKKKVEAKEKVIVINQYVRQLYFIVIAIDKKDYQLKESVRIAATTIIEDVQSNKSGEVFLVNLTEDNDLLLALAEGLILSNYQFLTYLKDKVTKTSKLAKISIVSSTITEDQINQIATINKAVFHARNLVNEPANVLSAPKLANEIERLGKEVGLKVTVFDKDKITELGMGGLLAVNKGSIDPPRFSIIEWNPTNAKNDKPYLFVGKGVVYDSGGLSLKPTPNSMDYMKCDMAGAAAVIGALYAIASLKLPFHVIGLVPSTDNRVSGDAYSPGDIIKMHNGLSVEVLNTDAEGRLILADALSYAQSYNPELVITLATLTGSAAAAIGKYGIVGMGNASEETFSNLKQSGQNVYERIVEFPFWTEYDELIKSDIADLKNLGGKEAGAITAGKFLEHFTNYPFIHLDIAAPAFNHEPDAYRGKGGSGVGVRLLVDFLISKMV